MPSSWTSSFQNCENKCVLNHLVCGTLLLQPQDTKAVPERQPSSPLLGNPYWPVVRAWWGLASRTCVSFTLGAQSGPPPPCRDSAPPPKRSIPCFCLPRRVLTQEDRASLQLCPPGVGSLRARAHLLARCPLTALSCSVGLFITRRALQLLVYERLPRRCSLHPSNRL